MYSEMRVKHTLGGFGALVQALKQAFLKNCVILLSLSKIHNVVSIFGGGGGDDLVLILRINYLAKVDEKFCAIVKNTD